MATNYKQISYGAKGSDVKTLQEKLNQNGYALDVDGNFGAKTRAAVKDYQQKNNLTVDGIVGKNTWGALNSVAANTAPQNTTASDIAETVNPGYKGYAPSDMVKQAQALLQQQMAFTKEQWDWEQKQAAKADNTGDNGNKATFANTLWTATGTYDENGNLIFRNSEGKTQAFAPGINPYTGTKHPDAKYGTFSNGYQPNNIGLDNNKKPIMLERTVMSTNIYGKEQTIWQANGKYWLWNGRKNKYEEVDISDLDE